MSVVNQKECHLAHRGCIGLCKGKTCDALLSLHRVRLDQQPIPLAEELDGLRLCSRAVRHRHDQLLAG